MIEKNYWVKSLYNCQSISTDNTVYYTMIILLYYSYYIVEKNKKNLDESSIFLVIPIMLMSSLAPIITVAGAISCAAHGLIDGSLLFLVIGAICKIAQINW